MKEKICVEIGLDHSYNCTSKVIGRCGENEITQLEITLPEELCECDAYLEFTKPDSSKFMSTILDIVDKKIVYDIPLSLLNEKGELEVQVVLRNDTEVWKSTIKKYTIRRSIDASKELEDEEDFILYVEKSLEECREKTEILKKDGAGDKFLSDDGTYKEVSSAGGGTSNYNDLENRPSINNVELKGNKTLEELGIQPKGNYTTSEDVQTAISEALNNIGIAEEGTY